MDLKKLKKAILMMTCFLLIGTNMYIVRAEDEGEANNQGNQEETENKEGQENGEGINLENLQGIEGLEGLDLSRIN